MSVDTATPFRFDNSFARELPSLYVDWRPDAVPNDDVLVLNLDLAAELGIDADWLAGPDGRAVLAGNAVPAGATPIAMAYAGHQFGSYSPRLGDGRALLLGEVVDAAGRRRDVHLKGSGRTPFARGGDGKAAVGPMLREFLVGEAMHALGVPTTRALAVAATGERIVREGMLPGAVLTRVAASHIRVGTFEYAARLGDDDLVRRLADHAIARHHPGAASADRPYLTFLESVVEAQASLVARWMSVGFIHGVMNTDNMTISGETIDYGPCAFLDRYDPATVYSSIDHGGRYAFGNQPQMALWNLTRLAETLLGLIDADVNTAVAAATEVLNSFPDRFRARWYDAMRAKLGLVTRDDGDPELFDDLLAAMHHERLDHTGFFRAAAASLRPDGEPLPAGLGGWTDRWLARLDAEGRTRTEVADGMDRANPLYIPRNHLVEEALGAATSGDMSPFRELLEVVTHPFDERPGAARFAVPAPDMFARTFQTFCGT
jgi:uncharacterized protein YdiU (UPF0061 family)